MKKRRIGRIYTILFLISAIIILITGCDLYDEEDYPEWNGNRYIKYEVTGSAVTVDITIENEDEGTSQFSDVSVPWTYIFPEKKYVDEGDYIFVYVSAQNQGETGTVTASIYYKKKKSGDYKQFKSSTSSGAYVIATASGALE